MTSHADDIDSKIHLLQQDTHSLELSILKDIEEIHNCSKYLLNLNKIIEIQDDIVKGFDHRLYLQFTNFVSRDSKSEEAAQRTKNSTEEVIEESADEQSAYETEVEVAPTMERYLSAIRKTQ